jgi:alpha-glucuronidase
MKKSWLLQGLIAIALACSNLNAAVIQIYPDAGPLERFAAREIRRYIYLRTDTVLPIQTGNGITSNHDVIVIGIKGQCLIGGRFGGEVGDLESQEYLIKTDRHSGRSVLWIVGGDAIGLLYGSYRFAETLGVRFYLHGDTIPDQKISIKIPRSGHQSKVEPTCLE